MPVLPRLLALAALALALTGPLQAQEVVLAGLAPGRALLQIDGAAPRFMSVGQSHLGVRLAAVALDHATVEVQGERRVLRLGQGPLAPAPDLSAQRRIVLRVDTGGHFTGQGQINGRSVRFMVDTGATALTLSESEARRLDLPYRQGRPVRVKTANGEITGHQLQLGSVRLGGHVSHNVAAVVLPADMPFVLLGNSFLSRFDLRRENDRMFLDPRY